MLADMLAVKNGSVTKDMLLGVMAMYAVPDRPVDGSALRAEWTREGLDTGLVPEARQPVHVFMEACRSVATGKRGVPSANRVTEINADLVTHDQAECVYQITRLVRDAAAGVIDHPKAMTLRFDKTTTDITCIPRDPESYQALAELEDRVRDHFNSNATRVPGNKVRNAVRETLIKSGGTNLRGKSGGVYFVPVAGNDTIEAMQRVLGALYGDDAYIHVIPWLNTEATQRIVKRHHVADVKARCEEMVAEIHNRLHNGKTPKVRKDFVANKMNDRMSLKRHAQEFEKLLGNQLDETREAISLLDDQIDKLLDATVE